MNGSSRVRSMRTRIRIPGLTSRSSEKTPWLSSTSWIWCSLSWYWWLALTRTRFCRDHHHQYSDRNRTGRSVRKRRLTSWLSWQRRNHRHPGRKEMDRSYRRPGTWWSGLSQDRRSGSGGCEGAGGQCRVNESLLTGESDNLPKNVGMSFFREASWHQEKPAVRSFMLARITMQHRSPAKRRNSSVITQNLRIPWMRSWKWSVSSSFRWVHCYSTNSTM